MPCPAQFSIDIAKGQLALDLYLFYDILLLEV